jgi:hypothetical protein
MKENAGSLVLAGPSFGFHDRDSTLWGWPRMNPIRFRDPSGQQEECTDKKTCFKYAGDCRNRCNQLWYFAEREACKDCCNKAWQRCRDGKEWIEPDGGCDHPIK